VCRRNSKKARSSWAGVREAPGRRWRERDLRVLGFLNSKCNVYIRRKMAIIIKRLET